LKNVKEKALGLVFFGSSPVFAGNVEDSVNEVFARLAIEF